MKTLFNSSTPLAQATGQLAEKSAFKYLKNEGLKPIERNYNCKYGEIDLIMLDGGTLVFVEVRYRKNTHFGSSAETVTRHKQQKLITTAQHFILSHSVYQANPCRFDVMALAPKQSASETFNIDWIKNAFTSET